MRALSIIFVLLIPQAVAAETWESALAGVSPKAQARIQYLCKSEANQEIFESVEGITAVIWKTDDGSGFAGVELHSYLSGITSSPPQWQYLRLGLSTVEFSSIEPTAARFKKMDNSLPIAKFDTNTRNISYAAKQTSFIEISYRESQNADDRELGIYGRTISVKNLKTGKTLARRTEFFWLANGARDENALCPSMLWSERSPASFLGKVINPATYSCMNDFEASQNALSIRDRYSAPARERLLAKLNECEKSYFIKNGRVH